MSYSDRHIVDTYSDLFEGLSFVNKIELIESLTKSLKSEISTKENDFYKSFGSFGSTKSAEDIISEIKSARNFLDKRLNFDEIPS